MTKSETVTTQQDEISEAVKQDNQRDIKFGASVQASYGSIEATSSFDMTNSQQMARESHAQADAPEDGEALVGDPQELQVDVQHRRPRRATR